MSESLSEFSSPAARDSLIQVNLNMSQVAPHRNSEDTC